MDRSAFHFLRHCWTSHRPVTFFRKRMVPPTPPSLVKFRRRLSAVMIGAAASMPMSDHVPELM